MHKKSCGIWKEGRVGLRKGERKRLKRGREVIERAVEAGKGRGGKKEGRREREGKGGENVPHTFFS